MRRTLTWSAGLLPLAAFLVSCGGGSMKVASNTDISIDITIRCGNGHVSADLDWRPHVTHGYHVTWSLKGDASSASVAAKNAANWPFSGTTQPYALTTANPSVTVLAPAGSQSATPYSYGITASCTDPHDANSTFSVVFDPDIVVD